MVTKIYSCSKYALLRLHLIIWILEDCYYHFLCVGFRKWIELIIQSLISNPLFFLLFESSCWGRLWISATPRSLLQMSNHLIQYIRLNETLKSLQVFSFPRVPLCALQVDLSAVKPPVYLIPLIREHPKVKVSFPCLPSSFLRSHLRQELKLPS